MFAICNISTSDWIQIAGIIVTSGLGVWIGLTVQKNLTNNRALKEYYISEIKSINEEYSIFLNCLYKSKTSSRSSQEWFKIMTIKLDTIQDSIVKELNILPSILANHITMKQFVTSTLEFNACYQSEFLVLSPQTKSIILDIHSSLKKSIVQAIIEINRA